MGSTTAITVLRGNPSLPVRRAEPLRAVVSPVADIYETNAAYVLTMDLPGVPKESVTVTITGEILSVAAENLQRQSDDAAVIHREILWNAYARSFNLGKDIDASNVAAEYADGVLTVTLPKHATAQPRRIEIN